MVYMNLAANKIHCHLTVENLRGEKMKKSKKRNLFHKNETGSIIRTFINPILKYGIPTEVLIDDGVSFNELKVTKKKIIDKPSLVTEYTKEDNLSQESFKAHRKFRSQII